MRSAGDFSQGPPAPIVLPPRPASNAERAATVAAARAWGSAEEDAVAQGTGCFHDRNAVRQALAEARGDTDQARGILGFAFWCLGRFLQCMQR